jgi:signal peptidase
MEIQTAPRPPAPTPWARLLLFAVLLGPVTLFVLLPIGLGLQRYVMTGDSMAGDRADSFSRGAVVFERVVPVDDLRPGDVITYRPPSSAGVDGMVTHRVVSAGPDGIVTQGDAEPAPDPWRVPAGTTVVPRVVFAVPWVGYAYLLLADPFLWLLLVGGLGCLGLLVAGNLRRSRPAAASPVSIGVGAEQ